MNLPNFEMPLAAGDAKSNCDLCTVCVEIMHGEFLDVIIFVFDQPQLPIWSLHRITTILAYINIIGGIRYAAGR